MRNLVPTAVRFACLLPIVSFAQVSPPVAPSRAASSVTFADAAGAALRGGQSMSAQGQSPTAGDPDVEAVETLSRQQTEALAIKNNPRITIAHLLSLAQQQQVTQSRSAFLPQLGGNLIAEDGYSGSRYPSGSLSDSRLIRHVGGSINLSQLITDFGRTHNLVASSKLEVKAEESTEQATREEIVLMADQAFFNTIEAQAAVQVAQKSLDERKNVQAQVAELTKNNLRSTLDASFANVDVSQAQLQLLDAQDAADASMTRLDAVLGLDHGETYRLLDDAQTAVAPPPPDVDVLVDMAIRQRPDLQSLAEQHQAQVKLSHAQKDQQLPTISAIGTVGGQPVRDGRYVISSWDGAIAGNINIPIFNGFLYSSEAKETALKASATDAQAASLRDAIARDVRVAWLDAKNSFRRIGVTDQLRQQANQSLKLAQARYTLGLSSIVELSQAQLQQTQAETGYANATYSYQAALAALEFQIGTQH
jgi:outer membrane protein